jgi:hypothetical protein
MCQNCAKNRSKMVQKNGIYFDFSAYGAIACIYDTVLAQNVYRDDLLLPDIHRYMNHRVPG